MVDELWQITVVGQKSALITMEQELENLAVPPLSLSLFEDILPAWRLEIIMTYEPAATLLEALQTRPEVQVTCNKLPDKNWVMESLRFLTPVRAGRFFVHGAHDAPRAEAVSVCIPAGMAFGTGHHETTRGCLLEFDRLLENGMTFAQVLDLGTGAGILAIAAAKTLQANILATDIDDEAITVAQQNQSANNLPKPVSWLVADGTHHPDIKPGLYDLVFANILAAPLIEMAQ
ncbi:Ribosomal protein L11 methyltransferase, partial [hydrothermal vent metagenome]